VSKSQENRVRSITALVRPEFAQELGVAAEVLGDITVSIWDPSIPEQADKFATIFSEHEAAKYESGFLDITGIGAAPRTPEQIQRQLVHGAAVAGSLIVLIEHERDNLTDFWLKTKQLSDQVD